MPKQKHPDYQNTCTTPIYQNVVYFFENTQQVIQYHEQEATLGRYGRYDNPNCLEVEQKIAALDNFSQSLVFSSGMTAVATTLLSFAKPKTRVLYTGKCYRNISKIFQTLLPKLDLETIPLDAENNEQFYQNFIASYDNNTSIVFIESPSNPHLYLVDLERIKQHINQDTLLIVDSTLASPLNFQPQQFGADLVIHSCSKYLGGHGDVLAGSVSGSSTLIDEIREHRNMLGGILDPHGAFLLNRSLDTLTIRMQHFNHAGLKVAQYLQQSPLVEKVFYTGLNTHPHAALAQKYLAGHGGVVSFEIKANSKTSSRFVDNLNVPFMGSNFGSSQAMVEQCSIFTYYKLTPEQRQDQGIKDNLIRLSVGYGDTQLLIDDLEQAFTTIAN